VAVGDAGCLPAWEERTCVSSWAVNAVIETLEGMDVTESKRESRRGKPGVERAETEELRTYGLGEELREVKGETSDESQSL